MSRIDRVGAWPALAAWVLLALGAGASVGLCGRVGGDLDAHASPLRPFRLEAHGASSNPNPLPDADQTQPLAPLERAHDVGSLAVVGDRHLDVVAGTD